MLCKACGEELMPGDHWSLKICRFCYVMDDIARHDVVEEEEDEPEEH